MSKLITCILYIVEVLMNSSSNLMTDNNVEKDTRYNLNEKFCFLFLILLIKSSNNSTIIDPRGNQDENEIYW